MTLDTKIRIMDAVALPALRDKANSLLATKEPEQAGPKEWYGGSWILGNEGGQGLPAWLLIYFHPDGPFDGDEEPPEDPEERVWWECIPRPCFAELSIDTSYGYRDGDATCQDLHAYFITEMGKWLDEQGLDWWWENEFTGEWFHGGDPGPIAKLGRAEIGCPFELRAAK